MLYNPSTDKIDCFKLKVSGFKTRQILWNIDYDQVYTEMSRWQCCRCCMWYKLHCYMLLCYNCNSFCHILHNINAVTVFQCHHHIIIRIAYNCKTKQDGPSLESSSYLNVSFRYLGPWDPWTLEPLDLWTFGPLPTSNTSSYFPIHPLPPTVLLWYGLVIGRLGGGRMRLEMDLWPLYWS